MDAPWWRPCGAVAGKVSGQLGRTVDLGAAVTMPWREHEYHVATRARLDGSLANVVGDAASCAKQLGVV
jgi:hypothetical protein